MKTYFQIADEYAMEMFPDHEYITDWYSFLNYYADKHVEWFGQYYMVLARMYAQEVAQHALNNAADNARIKADGGLYMSPYKFISVKGKQTYEHKVFIEKSTIIDDKNIDL